MKKVNGYLFYLSFTLIVTKPDAQGGSVLNVCSPVCDRRMGLCIHRANISKNFNFSYLPDFAIRHLGCLALCSAIASFVHKYWCIKWRPSFYLLCGLSEIIKSTGMLLPFAPESCADAICRIQIFQYL